MFLAEEHDLQAAILKYPHHGKTKLSAAFLADVNPAFVLITHGSVNSAESQKQLDKAGIPYTFASWGVIHLSCDGKEWHVVQEVIRRLKREGWTEVRQSGSHKQFMRNGVRITVPDHRGDLKPGIEKDIRKKAGW